MNKRTWRVHTSSKAQLMLMHAMIKCPLKFFDLEGVLDQHQNPITCPMGHCRYFLTISLKSVYKFSSYFANGQTHTDNCIISLVVVIIQIKIILIAKQHVDCKLLNLHEPMESSSVLCKHDSV